MFKSIQSYFKPLTREELELRDLHSSPTTRLSQEDRSEANAYVSAQVNEVIIIDGDDLAMMYLKLLIGLLKT